MQALDSQGLNSTLGWLAQFLLRSKVTVFLPRMSHGCRDRMKHLRTQNGRSSLTNERGAVRFETSLPVEVGNWHGIVRNISATGIYFEIEAALALGSYVSFAVELTVRGEKLKLLCGGEVLRVDHRNGGQGIAAVLGDSFFPNPAEVIDFDSRCLALTH